ncbi:uncharacterized protein LTR77_000777 [Saxophila tyrrhenica]|uniref:C2H2-type domain-containing protein n=1 Tax=Saxophila tyrrhenica TaxID=1690608 RepID=A0AAV9PQW9_9PEZI|nr:hypothetical protein LTR77_000777 [Saxophila tyrrhenica]
MNNQYYYAHPDIRVEASTPSPLPPPYDARQDSVAFGNGPVFNGYDDWQQMYTSGMGVPATSTQRPLKRARTHQRTPSASTVASTGPASPYTANSLYPQIANTDYSPSSPGQAAYADQPLYPKNLPTPSQTPTESSFYNYYVPSQAAHTPNAHLAMKGFAIDHHITDDIPQEFYHSSRHSMASRGNNSPSTPRSGAGEGYDARGYNQSGDFRNPNPSVQFYRTESQAYQDELYNPSANYTSVPAAAPTHNNVDLLTPHRNLVSERLQTANLARSASPSSAISRERSPFRDGSPLAPSGADWNPAAQSVGTAASMRQQQRAEAAKAEYDYHHVPPTLNREPTKTISPKDAVLEYTDGEQSSLFQDNIPGGYRPYTGSNETWQPDYSSQPASSFGNLVANGPNTLMPPFRANSSEGNAEANFSFTQQLPPTLQQQSSQVQGTQYQNNSYVAPKMNYTDTNPEFPAQLTSMESSVSEGGPPVSSQESYNQTSMPHRPSDTRAHTGTYTCTYHGCTQRFESHNSLQKHKRDTHRSQPREPTSDDNSEPSNSPRSTESPTPSTAGMTSAAIQARNSQAGPHKCTRINPSTNKPCNTIFSRPYDLTRHEDTIHNNRKMKVRCPLCREEKTFSRNDALTRHMRVVHPEVESYGKRGRRGD